MYVYVCIHTLIIYSYAIISMMFTIATSITILPMFNNITIPSITTDGVTIITIIIITMINTSLGFGFRVSVLRDSLLVKVC